MVTKQKTAAIYARVSTRTQEQEGSSLETQEQAARKHTAELGLVVSEAHVYREVYSGVELWDRPELTRLREAIKRKEIDVVIAHAVDRLSREPAHLGLLITEAQRTGVELLFVTEALDDSIEGQLIRFIRGFAAKFEHEKIKERSLRGKLARIRSGKLHSHGADLYGYRRDHELGRRFVYEPEAAVARQVFTWVGVDGIGLNEARRRLDAAGVLLPSQSKPTGGKRSATPRWTNSTLSRMLRNPAYKGVTIAWQWQGSKFPRPESEWITLPDNVTPAIVSDELWQAAQLRLDASQAAAAQKRNMARPSLLRGLVTCAVCGLPMYHGKASRGYMVFRCSSRQRAAGACGSQRAPAPDLEAWAWARVLEVLNDPAIIVEETKRQQEAGPDTAATAQLAQQQRELAKLESQQRRLIQRYSAADPDDKSFPWELLESEVRKLQQEKAQVQGIIATLEQRMARHQVKLIQLETLQQTCARIRAKLEGFDLERKRLALAALDVRVVATGHDWQLYGSVPVDGAGPDEGGVSFQTSMAPALRAERLRALSTPPRSLALVLGN